MRKPLTVLHRRRTRLWIALWVVLCLLGQQFALAAYACPMAVGIPSAAQIRCQQGMPMTPSPLCAQHCSPQVPASPDIHSPGVPALGLPPLPPLLIGSLNEPPHGVLPTVVTHVFEPPPTLLYCTLLI